MPKSLTLRDAALLAASAAVTVLTALAIRDSGWYAFLGNMTFAALGPMAFALGLWTRPQLGIPAAGALITVNEVQQGYANPFVIAIIGGAWIVGALLRSRQHLTNQLELRGRELDQEREVFAQESVRYERARIARELHDIVAHCVSVMVVQASAGSRVIDSDPELAAEALRNIAETAAQAQTEMSRLVELLDHDAAPAGEFGLALVDELVARAQATGLGVTCRFVGRSDDLPSGAAELVFSVVREAMTNALKHAPGAAIAVEVDSTGDDVCVSVTNTPAPDGVGVLHTLGGSHGLAGMRERVASHGGDLDAAPLPDGGWRVLARLPRGNNLALAQSS